jgi:hypothetical protein
MTPTWTEAAQAMQQYGGSFVQNLGRLYLLADPSNARKLVDAFPAYFAQYSMIAANDAMTKRQREQA